MRFFQGFRQDLGNWVCKKNLGVYNFGSLSHNSFIFMFASFAAKKQICSSIIQNWVTSVAQMFNGGIFLAVYIFKSGHLNPWFLHKRATQQGLKHLRKLHVQIIHNVK